MPARFSRRRTRPVAAARLGGGGLDRRQFLIRAGLVGGALVLAPGVLAACGDDGDDGGSGNGGNGGGGGGNRISVANWTAYIDEETIGLFEQETGISVDYDEAINDNNEFFAIIQPQLARGDSIDRDAFVFTDWMAGRIIDLEYAQPLDKAKLTNKGNLAAGLQSPGFDPDRTYSMPWQSGVTGIAYNIEATGGREIRTFDDFFSPDLKGRITMLTEMRDTIGLLMLADGQDPATATFASAEGAFARLEQAVNDDLLRGFTGNEYVGDLESGALAACIAWSGDVAQITVENPNIRYAVPESGGMLWSDNYMIPVTSEKADLSTEFINFYYDPVNAAKLTAFVQYISPVNGVADELRKLGGDAAAVADNPLVVPTPEFLDQLTIFGPLDEEEETRFDERFAEIAGL